MSTSHAGSGEQHNSQIELEREAGRRASARYRGAPPTPSKDVSGTAGTGAPFNSGKRIETGLEAAAKLIPPPRGAPTSGVTASNPMPIGEAVAGAVTTPVARAEAADPDLNDGQPAAMEQPRQGIDQEHQYGESQSLDFLDDFFGNGKRHLVGIKKANAKGKWPTIRARHFDAGDRAGQQQFITELNAAGFDLYFSPNPIKGTLHKKAKKNDVAEACHLWIDLDPREGQPLEAERAAMLELLTTGLPAGLPPPNRVIDSGRGYWGYWKLDTAMPVDGAAYDDKGRFVRNNPLTEAVESYGRGTERAFGDRFADGCRNIDRVARLPGTINHKTGQLACVLHEYSHDEPCAVVSFPRRAESTQPQEDQPFTASERYEAVARDAPELANVKAVWITRIFDGDVDGNYRHDRSRLAFAVACELIRAGIGDDFVARVLMTTKCGEHIQDNPAYRLARTIRRAQEFAIDPDLEEMNSKHAVLPIGDKTRVVTWDNDPDFLGRKTIVRAQSFPDFKNLHSNKRKIIETKDKNGKFEEIEISLGAWWLSQVRRRQYDGGQRFMPHHNSEVVANVLNMFQGFPIQPRKPEGRSAASNCQLFLDHGFKIMCSGNAEHWEYLLKREAWIAQHRRRSEIAAAYRTEAEGSGKGFWCNHLGRLYGPYYMQINKPEHVIGKHNPHLETLLKLCADEALFVGDPRHRNALFSLITEPTITIEPKNINVYSAPNYLNIDMTTNSKHFVPASRTARRFFIPTVSEERAGDLAYFSAIEAQLKDGGYEALLYHLLYEVDLRDFDVRRVPKTAGLAEQVEYSRKGLDGMVEKICNEGCVPCAHQQWPGFSITSGYEQKQGFDYFIDSHPDRELKGLGSLKVKRELRKHWQCKSGDDAKRRDGTAMVSGVKWSPLMELRALFEQRHGAQEWLHPEITEWPVAFTEPGRSNADAGAPEEADTEIDGLISMAAKRARADLNLVNDRTAGGSRNGSP